MNLPESKTPANLGNLMDDETLRILSGYKITFSKVPLLNTWTWRATAPDGTVLMPYLGHGFARKAAAEAEALKRIEAHASTETIKGDELAKRLSDRRSVGA